VGAKLVTVYETNHKIGLTSHLATIVLLDHDTGALAAVMDGRYITEARTAAVSAVSVKHLARPDASVLGILGSGVQARSHLKAICHVRNLKAVRVWSPTPANRDRFVTDMSEATGLPVTGAASASDAVRGADIIVIASSSRTPVIADADVSAGAHIVGVGACRPDQREMPTPLVARAGLVVFSRAAARVEAGDVLIPISEGAITQDHIAGELGELVTKRATGRTDAKQVTIFKSLGLAVEDMVAAHLALDRARAAGLGQAVSW
jgi:ornithine cyclodeaminase